MLYAELPTLASPDVTAGGPTRLATLLREVEQAVSGHFPQMLPWLKATLAVSAIRCLKDNTQPVALIAIGSPSSGKSTPLSFLAPDGDADELARFFHHTDHFTAASFVSHQASKTADRLAEVDLLPRIRNKTLLTPELAPLFRSRGNDLSKSMATLAAVLDGRGYVSHSGAHGERGHRGQHNFGWLGASTPLSSTAFRELALIGPKIFMFDVTRRRVNALELACAAAARDDSAALEECRAAVRRLVIELYWSFPPGSVPIASVSIDRARLHLIALWTELMTVLRAAKDHEPEYPERPLKVLRLIAAGSALAHGRLAVDDFDLALVGHVAMSSAGNNLPRILRGVLLRGGAVSTPELAADSGLTDPTVRHYMRLLGERGVALHRKASPETVELTGQYEALCRAPLLGNPPASAG